MHHMVKQFFTPQVIFATVSAVLDIFLICTIFIFRNYFKAALQVEPIAAKPSFSKLDFKEELSFPGRLTMDM